MRALNGPNREEAQCVYAQCNVVHHVVLPSTGLPRVSGCHSVDDLPVSAVDLFVATVRLRGWSYVEVARMLGIPGTVMSRLHRARAAIRRALTAAPSRGNEAA